MNFKAMMMKRHLMMAILMGGTTLMAMAQNEGEKPFKGYLYNKEYSVFLRMNFYEQNISIPGQELYGPLPGYLGKDRYTFYWPIVTAEVKDGKAILTMVNDYGSEDLTAQLTQVNDSVFELKQLEGSTLKMPDNRKWQKLPKVLELKRK